MRSLSRPDEAHGLEARDRFETLNDLRFHYREWGNAEAPVLVILHGFSSHARAFDNIAPALAGRRVLALDQRGHGETEWARDYAWRRFVEDVDAFVGALGLRRFALLGHSMGALVAALDTAAHPEAVERLLLLDWAPRPVPAAPAPPPVPWVPGVFDRPEDAVRTRRAFPVFRRSQEAALRHSVVTNLKQLADGRWTWRWDPALATGDPGTRISPLSADAETVWSALAAIGCPTLLIRAAEGVPPELAEPVVRAMPDCRVVEIPESGHAVPLDNPDALIAAIRAFL
jgi:pimeloyl-ACP methyl ester carboxylesterase